MEEEVKEEEKEAISKLSAKSVSSWKLIVIILTPILLLPLPLVARNTESKCAYVVLLMTAYWMTEAVPLAATALLPIGLYPLLGVLNAAETAANYFKDTNFLIFGSLLMAVAVETTGLQFRIALRILIWFGAKPQWLIFGFMCTAGFLSMWISNTATCAMMLPIVIVVLQEILQQRRRLAADGTPDDTKMELSAVAGGPPATSASPPADTIFGEALSKEELGFCRAACIGVAFASSVGGIGALTGATSNLILQGQLKQFYPQQNLITFANWFAFGMPMQALFTIVGWIWLLVYFMGWKSGLRCFGKSTESDQSIGKLLRLEYEKLSSIRFDEAAVGTLFTVVILLWVTREPGFTDGWGSLFKSGYVTDSTPVMVACFILFAIPSNFEFLLFWRRRRITDSLPPEPRNAASSSSGPSKKLCPTARPNWPKYKPIMCWTFMQDQFPWAVIVLLGGGFALADGVKKSGLSDWLGCSLQSNLSRVNPVAIVLLFLILLTAVSEFASNTATANVFVPILLTVGESMGTNPLYFGMAAAVGSSFGFMLPVATPPNMIVFEKCKQLGILGPAEMIKAGAVLDVLCIAIAFLTLHTTGYWVYGLNEYPDWAHSAQSYSACNRTAQPT